MIDKNAEGKTMLWVSWAVFLFFLLLSFSRKLFSWENYYCGIKCRKHGRFLVGKKIQHLCLFNFSFLKRDNLSGFVLKSKENYKKRSKAIKGTKQN